MPAPEVSFVELFNFRDLGGHVGIDGRTVRWRRLFRSDSLHRLSGTDRAAFTALGVRTVIDLRRPAEVARDGRVPDGPGLGYHHIHPEHAEWRETGFTTGQDLERWLADRYLDLAAEGAVGLAAAVGLIADERSAPVVVHCVAGKDRTGVVCALTLSLLGVPEADIAADYARSTVGSSRFTEWLRRTDPTAADLPAPYLASPAGAMLRFLAGLRDRYGSVSGYLTGAGLAGEQVDALRRHLLTPAGS